MNTREQYDAEKWIAREIGAATTSLASLQARLTATVNGKPQPKAAQPITTPTVLDELIDLDALTIVVYLTLNQAQRGAGGPVRTTRAELASKVHRSPRSVTRALRKLRERKLIYKLGRSTYGVRTTMEQS